MEHYFCASQKNRQNHNQHFKLLFFKLSIYTLAHQTKYLHVEMKFNSHKRYLMVIFSL